MTRTPFVFRFQVTPFVILFVERAGSTYLVTALKAHPGVHAVTEKLGALRLEGKGAAEQLAWAKAFLTPPLIGRNRTIGFKTKLIDVLDPAGFARLVRDRGCRVIHLTRLNAVKGAISTLNARRQWEVSGNWNRLSEQTRLAPFVVDPAQFDETLKERERLDRELSEYIADLRVPTLRLHYEDLLRDREAFVTQVLSFLGNPQEPRTGATLKNTGDDLREAIVNFDELRARYAGTRYETMFDEIVVPSSHGGRTPCLA